MSHRKMFQPGEMKLDDAGHLTAAFAQLGVIDSDGDVTVKGAFPVKDVALSAYGHTSWDGALPVGKGTISEQGDWAVFEGDFFTDTTHGNDAYLTVKGLGPLAEYSYGFTVLDSAQASFEGKSVRELRSLDVFEVSPVLKGAGVGTHTLALKSDDLEPGASFADESAWLSGKLAAFLERATARKEMRDNEGRKLSRVDIARLEDLEDMARKYADTLRELRTLPEDPEAARRRMAGIMVELATARRLGVAV